ncbi:hypothetical protein JHK85_016911 [Glycine max]|nr:hypothetical protein JHK85_016911 [Glycine max]
MGVVNCGGFGWNGSHGSKPWELCLAGGNGDKLMPKPKVPGFYPETEVTSVANCSLENHRLCSVNELSIRMLDAR